MKVTEQHCTFGRISDNPCPHAPVLYDYTDSEPHRRLGVRLTFWCEMHRKHAPKTAR